MASLPSYVSAARPIPMANRAAWFKNTAPTYAGIMLWFVFWQDIVGAGGTPGGVLAAGLGTALLGLVLAALICHFLFYVVPGMLGMKTGLPLYIVGTSTYGVRGGFLMPGFLMGLLQFGWLAVNAFAVSAILCKCFGVGLDAGGEVVVPGVIHGAIAALFAAGAAFMGLKGIQYVAKVATYLPLIPLIVLLVLAAKTIGGLGTFEPAMVIQAAGPPAVAETADAEAMEAAPGEAKAAVAAGTAQLPLGTFGVIAILCTYVVGFFATAGAAGVDFGMNNRNASDVQWGGLIGIALATIYAGGLAILIVAAAYGAGLVPEDMAGKLNPIDVMRGGILSERTANVIMILLAVSSFPPACFSSLIAANSFKTTLPNVNPFASVGVGTAVAILLAVTGLAGKVVMVFVVIGASFGPVCGAMAADYLLAGRKWAGPRAGFNPAGWISWVVGFAVGAVDFIPALRGTIPAPPVAAFFVGFVLYFVLAQLGLQSKPLPLPSGNDRPTDE